MTDLLIRDVPDEPVTVASLRRFADTFGDLGDAEIVRGAWQ